MNPSENSQKSNLKPYQGVLFIIGMLAAYLGISWILPASFGFLGTFLVQLLFILAPVLYVFCLKRELQTVFPLRKPSWMGLMGTTVLWIGSFLVNLSLSGTLMYLFPEQGMNTGVNFMALMGDVPGLILILVVCVMPAIGEELTFRGVFLNSLSRLRRSWMGVLLVGIVFGAFHMDPIKLIPTALIGIFLCLMLQQSGNMVYNAFFHFLNNFVSVSLLLLVRKMTVLTPSYEKLMEQAADSAQQNNLMITGMYWIFGSAGPFLIYLGFWMLKKATRNTGNHLFSETKGRRNLILVITASVLCVIVGMTCFITGFYQMMP